MVVVVAVVAVVVVVVVGVVVVGLKQPTCSLRHTCRNLEMPPRPSVRTQMRLASRRLSTTYMYRCNVDDCIRTYAWVLCACVLSVCSHLCRGKKDHGPQKTTGGPWPESTKRTRRSSLRQSAIHSSQAS